MKHLIGFLFLIVLILAFHNYIHNKISLKNIKWNKNTSFQSGDLLYITHKKPCFESGVQMLTNRTPFTHMALIYCSGNKCYLIESHPKKYNKKTDKNGVHIYPLHKRISEYHGQIYIQKLKNSLTNNQQCKYNKIVHNIRKYNNLFPFPNNIGMGFNYVKRCFLGVPFDPRDGINCTELVSFILSHIQISDINIGCSMPKSSIFKDYYQNDIYRIK